MDRLREAEGTSMPHELIQRIRRFDESRSNLPGEHWLTFAAGIGLWVATRRHPSGTIRLVAGILGGLLVARAAAGTQVPGTLKKAVPDTNWLSRRTGRVVPTRA
jgi:hypothetical protein